MEPETLICPFCYAPFREVVPSGTVQVRCRYCGGIILIPSMAPRCPNHPGVLIVGLCNDCGGSYCDGCLYLQKVENATLYLCPSCFKRREAKGTTVALIMGFLLLLLGFFAVLIPTVEGLINGSFSLVAGFTSLVLGIYKRSHFPEGVTVKARREAKERQKESRKSWASQASDFELYQIMLNETMQEHGADTGWQVMKRSIDSYVKKGMTRSQALRKMAEEKGY